MQNTAAVQQYSVMCQSQYGNGSLVFSHFYGRDVDFLLCILQVFIIYEQTQQVQNQVWRHQTAAVKCELFLMRYFQTKITQYLSETVVILQLQQKFGELLLPGLVNVFLIVVPYVQAGPKNGLLLMSCNCNFLNHQNKTRQEYHNEVCLSQIQKMSRFIRSGKSNDIINDVMSCQ